MNLSLDEPHGPDPEPQQISRDALPAGAHVVGLIVPVVGPLPGRQLVLHRVRVEQRERGRDVEEAGALIDPSRSVADERRVGSPDQRVARLRAPTRSARLLAAGLRRPQRSATRTTSPRRTECATRTNWARARRHARGATRCDLAVDHPREHVDVARKAVRRKVRVQAAVRRGTARAEVRRLNLTERAIQLADSDREPRELDIAQDALVRRRVRRAGGQRADARAGAAARHRREAVIPCRRDQRDPDVEHRERQLILDVAARKERGPAEAHVDDLDVQRVELERVVLGPGAADGNGGDSVVEIAAQRDRAVHRRDDSRLRRAAALRRKHLERIDLRRRRCSDHRNHRRAGRTARKQGAWTVDGAARRVEEYRLRQSRGRAEPEVGVRGDHVRRPGAVPVVEAACRRSHRILRQGHEVLAADHGRVPRARVVRLALPFRCRSTRR